MTSIFLTFWITCGPITVRDEWAVLKKWDEILFCFAFGWLWQILRFTSFTNNKL